MPRKLLFVVNPNSGKGEMRLHIVDCVDLFVKAGYEVTLYTTQKAGDASRIVATRGSHFDLIICSGGDGTLNETVAGLMQLNEKPSLGYIPSGTTNDFATSLAIPKKATDAAELILRGIPSTVDVGRFNDRYFTYVAGFGAFTEVAYSTPQNTKNTLGRLAYILEGIKSLPTLRNYHVKVEHDDQVIEDDFIFGMVTNATTVGGFKGIISSDVGLDDGLFEVFLVKAPSNPIELQMIFNELLLSSEQSKFIVRFKSKHVRFIADTEMPWTLDGEFGGAPQVTDIFNCQKALHLYVGSSCPVASKEVYALPET